MSFLPPAAQPAPEHAPAPTIEAGGDAALRARVAALEAENAHLASALRIAEVIGTWDWDVRADRIVANATFARTYGVDPVRAAVGGVPIAEYLKALHPDDRPRVRTAIDDALRRGGAYSAEYRLVVGDGPARHVLAQGRCEHDGAGQPTRFYGVTVDITARQHAEAALREKTAELESLLSHAPIGVAFFDPERRFLRINTMIAELNGLPVEAHIGRRLEEVLPVNARTVAPLLDQVFAEGVALPQVEVSGETPRQPGVLRHWLTGYYPVLDERGRVRAVGAWATEISERKTSELAVRRSERRYRSFVEASAQVVWRVNAAGEVDEPIPVWQAYTGQTFEEARGLGWMTAIREGDRAAVSAAWKRALATGSTYEVEYMLRRGDGEWRAVLARGVPVRDDAGAIVEWIGTCLDIQDRKTTEARLALALEGTSDGLWDWDIVRGEVFHSPRWIAMLGYTPDEWASTYENWLAHTHPDDVAPTEETLRRYLAGELADYVNIFRMRHKDGSWRWMMSRAKVLRDAHGTPLRMVGAHTDITAQKAAEEELRLHREELARLVEERTAELLRAAEERRRAEEAMRQSEKRAALGQLTGGVAHDFGNLLQVVSSGAQLLKRPSLPEERRAAILEGMIQAGQAARDITSRLLAFARRQSLAPETFDLNARLRGMVDLLRQTLGAGVRIEADLAADLWPVHCDPGQLEVALLNLAVNARDAMPGGGTLTLRTRNAKLPASPERDAGEYVCLTVEDAGTGMPPAVLARIFEPFFTTKGPGQGTGLGLPQVFGFAKQSGGDIQVESEVGRGTVFLLHLPRAMAAEAGAPAPGSGAVLEALRTSAGRTVLVVDDNAQAAEFAAQMLGELGYRTIRAGSGVEAIARLGGGEPVDALVSDVVMPGGVGGVELAAICRAMYPHVAVVLTTGYSDQVTAGRAPRDVEVLTKPYRQEELAAAVLRALAAAPARGEGGRGLG